MNTRILVGGILLLLAMGTLFYSSNTNGTLDATMTKTDEKINTALLSNPTNIILQLGIPKVFQEYGMNLQWKTIEEITLTHVDCPNEKITLQFKSSGKKVTLTRNEPAYTWRNGMYYMIYRSCTEKTATLEVGLEILARAGN